MQTLGARPEAEPCTDRIPCDTTVVPLAPLCPKVSANGLISTLKELTKIGEERPIKTP